MAKVNKSSVLKNKLHTDLIEIRDVQVKRMEDVHQLCHDFLRDFERAVLRHELLAILEGRDPKEATRALRKLK